MPLLRDPLEVFLKQHGSNTREASVTSDRIGYSLPKARERRLNPKGRLGGWLIRDYEFLLSITCGYPATYI